MTLSNKTISTAEKTEKLQALILATLADLKAEDIAIFVLPEDSDIADVAIICTGRSNRHARSIATNLADAIKKSHIAKVRIEDDTKGEWMLVDAGHIIVHAMQPEIRKYYQLDEWLEKY